MAIAPTPPRLPAADAAPTRPLESVHVVPWPEPVGSGPTFHVRSRYAERFWLPVLGPSALWLLRHMVERLERSPRGYELDLQPTARAIGLGGLGGRHAPFRRAMLRCARFGALRRRGAQTVAVRLHLPPIPAHVLARLPEELRAEHHTWLETPATLDRLRPRTRQLALELVPLFAERVAVEAELHAMGIHPALAHESAEWAVDLYQRLRCTTSSNGRRSGLAIGVIGRSAG